MNKVLIHFICQTLSAIIAWMVSHGLGFSYELFFIIYFGFLIYLTPPNKPKE
jgi:hypothetical protein